MPSRILGEKYRMVFVNRVGIGVVNFKNKLWLLGGWDPKQTPNLLNEVYNSSDGVNFTKQANTPWKPRHSFASIFFRNRIWVLGEVKASAARLLKRNYHGVSLHVLM